MLAGRRNERSSEEKINSLYTMERLLRLLKESAIPSHLYGHICECITSCYLLFPPNVTYPGIKSGDIYFYCAIRTFEITSFVK